MNHVVKGTILAELASYTIPLPTDLYFVGISLALKFLGEITRKYLVSKNGQTQLKNIAALNVIVCLTISWTLGIVRLTLSLIITLKMEIYNPAYCRSINENQRSEARLAQISF